MQRSASRPAIPPRMAKRLASVIDVRRGEREPTVLAGATFFLILCSYMLIRPVREAMGVERAFDDLYWLWFGTLGGMVLANALYAFLAARVRVRMLAPIAYGVFALSLAGFMVLLIVDPTRAGRGIATLPGWVVGSGSPQPLTLGHVFYVWLSIFNLFVISLFWAQAAATFGLEQSKRLFPVVAAGGTMGAVAGSFLATQIAELVGPAAMMGVSLALLCGAIALGRVAFANQAGAGDAGGAAPERTPGARSRERAPRLDVLAGVRSIASSRYMLCIGAWVTLLAVGSSLLYFTQAEIVRDRGRDLAERIALFAQIDLLTQGITLLLQLTATAGLLRVLGVGRLLLAGPVVLVVGYAALAAAPVYATIALFQACFRAAERGVARPARETLFTVVPAEQKYVTKPFLDTFVYRAGDVVGMLAHRGLHAAAAGLWPVVAAGFALAAVWGGLGLWLGRAQRRLAERAAAGPSGAGAGTC